MCRIFKYDILYLDSIKREIVIKLMTNLDRIAYKLELIRDNRGLNYILYQLIVRIKEEVKELEDISKKYDYCKLPNDL